MTVAQWQGRKEGGGRFALWLIRSIGLTCGRGVARLILYPITLYFFFRRGHERRASRAFLTRALGRPAGVLDVLRHIHAFASITLDRVFLLARGMRGFDIEIVGMEALERRLDSGRGVLLLGAHVGSFEVLRVLALKRPQIPLRVVLDKAQTPVMTELLEALAPDIGNNVIDASRGSTDVVLAMHEAAQHGAMVALLGDRGRAHEAMRRVPFFGEPAPFPAAPWLIASTLQLPVVLCFGLYLGGNRYRLMFEPYAEEATVPRAGRKAALDALIRGYAARLEAMVREHPHNWFNFYDFWHDPAPDGGADPGRADQPDLRGGHLA